ncbi:MAG: ABC transporter ATP-binding protein/permease [Erysipelotrichaceae bacterium]|nr:ABC transporter ATP-binding protein/permease [Erysipelotrichaceae bacterium]
MNTKTRFLKYIKNEKSLIALIFVFVFFYVLANLLTPFLVGKALDEALAMNANNFIFIIVLISIICFAGVLAGYLFEYFVAKLVQNIIKQLRDEVYFKITNVSLNEIYVRKKGDIVQYVIGDIENVSNGLFSIFKSLIEGILSITMTIVMMFIVNYLLAILVIVLTPISVFVSRFIAKFSHDHFKKQTMLQADLSAISFENISNIDLVQSYDIVDEANKKFDEQNKILKNHSRIALFSASWVNPSTRLVNNIIYGLIGVFGIILIVLTPDSTSFVNNIHASLSIGGLASFLSYANQYGKPFNEVSSVMAEFETALSSFKRINEFLNIDNEENKGNLSLTKIDNISFKNVKFSYDKNKELIKNFSLDIKKGDKIAIVGPTGAGKTTLINILLHFYDINSGDITFDDVSINNIEKNSLRNNFAMVLQETWIFSGTIKENIAYVKDDASDEEIIRAAKLAHADTFIDRLPKGYDTFVSSKDGLSEGEKQMIAIARLFLLNPDVVILDEATSSIDTRSEKLIGDAFDKIMENNTSIVIAHRLSTIQKSDVILVLKDGDVIEQGNHTYLMNKKGFYYSMYSSQFK